MAALQIYALLTRQKFWRSNLHTLFIKLMKRNIPVKYLRLLTHMVFVCYICVKWANIQSDFFSVASPGSVLAPVYLISILIRWTTRYSLSVDVVSTAAQLYDKSHLNMWITLKVTHSLKMVLFDRPHITSYTF